MLYWTGYILSMAFSVRFSLSPVKRKIWFALTYMIRLVHRDCLLSLCIKNLNPYLKNPGAQALATICDTFWNSTNIASVWDDMIFYDLADKPFSTLGCYSVICEAELSRTEISRSSPSIKAVCNALYTMFRFQSHCNNKNVPSDQGKFYNCFTKEITWFSGIFYFDVKCSSPLCWRIRITGWINQSMDFFQSFSFSYFFLPSMSNMAFLSVQAQSHWTYMYQTEQVNNMFGIVRLFSVFLFLAVSSTLSRISPTSMQDEYTTPFFMDGTSINTGLGQA